MSTSLCLFPRPERAGTGIYANLVYMQKRDFLYMLGATVLLFRQERTGALLPGISESRCQRYKKSYIKAKKAFLEIFFPDVGTSEHLFRAFQSELAGVAAHDVGDFTNALFGAKFVDKGNGAFIVYLLIYIVMRVGKRGDLR